MDHAQEVPATAGGSGPEVPEKAKRRRFDAAYKLRILEEADRATGTGELGPATCCQEYKTGGPVLLRLYPHPLGDRLA